MDSFVAGVLGTEEYNKVFASVSESELLKMDRRKLLQLGLAMPAANKLGAAIQKRSEEVANQAKQVEAAERERLVNEKMTSIAAQQQQPQEVLPPQQSPPHVEQVVVAVEKTVSVSGEETADLWSVARVAEWVRTKLGEPDIAAKCEAREIDGPKLLALQAKDLPTLGCESIQQRRKFEHGIETLRAPIEEAKKQQQEVAERTFEGDISRVPGVGQKKTTLSKHLQNGLFAYVTHTASSVLIECENSSKKPPMPVLFTVHVKCGNNVVCENGLQEWATTVFLAPNVNVKVDPVAGTVMNDQTTIESARCTVVKAKAKAKDEPYNLTFKVSYAVATIKDWLALDNQKKSEEAQRQLELTGITTLEKLSVADLEARLLDVSCVPFVDPDFPPQDSSLYIDVKSPPPNVAPVQWKRPKDFGVDNPVLFSRPPQATDIRQGQLGDCWFIASVSILVSRHPALVAWLFETLSLQNTGVVACRFFRGGQWVRVVTDTYLPCSPLTGWIGFDIASLRAMHTYIDGTGNHETEGPVYGRCGNGDLWLCYLEKAYAKLNRSYQALWGGSLAESLTDLSGSPCISVFLPWMESKDEAFRRLYDGHKRGFFLGCSTRMLTPEERRTGFQLEKFGIVGRHAYGISNIVVSGTTRLLQVRNPWGQFTWNGDFSDNSQRWTDALRKACDYKAEPGAFWMQWSDFINFFSEVVMCCHNSTKDWKTRRSTHGQYDRNQIHGPQCRISDIKVETLALVTISKEDLRWAQGSDKDNRQGIYLLERDTEDGAARFVDSTGEFCRRDVSLLATLKPGKVYDVVVMSTIGNVKFETVNWSLHVEAAEEVAVTFMPQPNLKLLCQASVLEILANISVSERCQSEIYALQHLGFLFDEQVSPPVSLRLYMLELGIVDLVLQLLRRYPKEQELVNLVLSLVWALGSSTELREAFRKTDLLQLIKEAEQRFYSDEETRELCDVASRNITNAGASIAMDPFVENCIVHGCCTYAVTGRKSYLMQVWYDCATCNLRSNFGVCQVCAMTCHKGHVLSRPKFAKFFCDCGAGSARKKSDRIVSCVCRKPQKELDALGIKKKREKDKNYIEREADESDDESDDEEKRKQKERAKQVKVVEKKTGVATLFGK